VCCISCNAYAPTDITTDTLPGIEHLTALHYLEAVSCDLEPSCLLPLTTNLTSLHLDGVELEPFDAQPEAVLQLLQVVARLPALRMLVLECIEAQCPQQQLSAYSALTASSNLQQLRLRNCDLPTAARVHVFPAGRQLPQLTSFWAWPGSLDSAAIARLVSCCPAVEGLCVGTWSGVSVTPLKSLTALTSLSIGPVEPAAIRSVLPALSRLKHLAVMSVFDFDDPASLRLQGLMPLTALTNLTSLSTNVQGVQIQSKVSTSRAGVE
jgi:hypothetical protein